MLFGLNSEMALHLLGPASCVKTQPWRFAWRLIVRVQYYFYFQLPSTHRTQVHERLDFYFIGHGPRNIPKTHVKNDHFFLVFENHCTNFETRTKHVFTKRHDAQKLWFLRKHWGKQLTNQPKREHMCLPKIGNKRTPQPQIDRATIGRDIREQQANFRVLVVMPSACVLFCSCVARITTIRLVSYIFLSYARMHTHTRTYVRTDVYRI